MPGFNAPGGILLGVDFTRTYTALASAGDPDVVGFTLGSVGMSDDGNLFRFVQANGAISANNVVTIDGGYDVTPLSGAGLAWAVARVAIADNAYGWVQTGGIVTASVETSLADNALISRLTNGSGQLQATDAVNESGSTSHGAGAQSAFAKALAAESSNLASIFIF